MQSVVRRRIYLPEDLSLRPANREDDPFLYRLLVERYENPAINIPEMALPELPTYEQHVAHLDRRPYERIEIVSVESRPVGMLYLTRESVIGCFVLRDLAARGVGLAACYRFLQTCSYPLTAHLSRRNRPARRTAERLGFVRVETAAQRVTYVLRGSPVDPFGPMRERPIRARG